MWREFHLLPLVSIEYRTVCNDFLFFSSFSILLYRKFFLRTSFFYVQKGKWLMINLQDLIKSGIIPSLTVSKRQNSCKSRIYGLCGCLFVCIDMCYIFVFVLVVFFVFEIIPRMEAFDINSKSVLNPNEL